MDIRYTDDIKPRTATHEGGVRSVKVWDFPTRIFHWALVVLIGVTWVFSEADGAVFMVHVYSGTLVLGLVVFRLVWGVIGSRYARFDEFVRGPETVKHYAKQLAVLRPPHHLGHNPLGGWMILALIGVILFTVLSGMMTSDADYVGPLAFIGGGYFEDIHEGLANFLLLLIVGHVLGVLIHALITGENLPRAMVTGKKQLDNSMSTQGIKSVGILRPLIALAMAMAVVLYFMI